MQFHKGRLIDHVHLRVSNLEASKRFYRAVIESLNLASAIFEDSDCFCTDELFIDKADGHLSRVHLAFQARDRATVHKFYAAALAAGGTDNGAPGERSYHPDYYAAFVLDPDGNNIEAVHHGDEVRSAESVMVTPIIQ
jgi:catechol 2,3-dioxygenase-like lactoylglutathione lyase family enzyme